MAVAAMKQTDISTERTFPWFLIISGSPCVFLRGDKCYGGMLQNEMSCWMDEGCSPVLLNLYLMDVLVIFNNRIPSRNCENYRGSTRVNADRK